MRRVLDHSARYHEWPASTPVLDAVACVLAVASVVIGSYAALFLVFALGAGDRETALADALFFVAIGLAHGLLEVVRRWRRHHA
jgi:hypothetical protein